MAAPKAKRVRVNDPGQTEKQQDLEEATCSTSLALWNPQPITRPQIDSAVLDLPPAQRGVEVILYWTARTEHWLSPTGWLRAWVRLNLWVAVVLAVCAFTVLPAVAVTVAGLAGLTLEISRISDDLGRSFASLLPLIGGLILAGVVLYVARRHGRTLPGHRPQTREGEEGLP